MPSTPPPGDPAPPDGALPAHALETLGRNGFGVYVHVPYCAHRCGYCDFNTYVAGTGAAALVRRRRHRRGRAWRRGCSPSRRRRARSSSAAARRRCCRPPTSPRPARGARRDRPRGRRRGHGRGQPGDRRPGVARRAARGRLHRVSLGMQSAVPHVLATLERRHTRGRAPEACARRRARPASTHVSLDLIYGTPGETDDDWRALGRRRAGRRPRPRQRVRAHRRARHRLHAQVRARRCAPDDDVQADRYELADDALRQAGLRLVRGLATGRAPSRPVPPQPGLLARRRLVGRRAGRAQPRRRRALVERPAAPRPRGAPSPRGVRPRRRARCSTTRPAGSNASCSASASPTATPRPTSTRGRRSGSRQRGCSTPPPWPEAALVLTGAAGCSPTR